MSRRRSLHEALLYNQQLSRPEPVHTYLSFEEGAERIYTLCAQRDGRVLARILQEVQPLHDRYGRHARAVEIFYSSLTGGCPFPGYDESGRREISRNISHYFGLRQTFQTEHDLKTFIDELGKYLCGEKQLSVETALEKTR